MTPKEFREKQEFQYDHFFNLTSTGISPNYDNMEKFAEEYHQAKLKLLGIGGVSGSFIAKCAVTNKSGEHCPEKPTKKINGDYVCDRCYENWKHLENNGR